jgi:hypothetical protein
LEESMAGKSMSAKCSHRFLMPGQLFCFAKVYAGNCKRFVNVERLLSVDRF